MEPLPLEKGEIIAGPIDAVHLEKIMSFTAFLCHSRVFLCHSRARGNPSLSLRWSATTEAIVTHNLKSKIDRRACPPFSRG